MLSHTLDCGDMKVWNLRVTDCWAKPTSAGAPKATAAPDWSRVLRWIMDCSPVL
jgi:hypothetical protein